jgi:hypothetical protein
MKGQRVEADSTEDRHGLRAEPQAGRETLEKRSFLGRGGEAPMRSCTRYKGHSIHVSTMSDKFAREVSLRKRDNERDSVQIGLGLCIKISLAAGNTHIIPSVDLGHRPISSSHSQRSTATRDELDDTKAYHLPSSPSNPDLAGFRGRTQHAVLGRKGRHLSCPARVLFRERQRARARGFPVSSERMLGWVG